jgi:hypothetical protein
MPNKTFPSDHKYSLHVYLVEPFVEFLNLIYVEIVHLRGLTFLIELCYNADLFDEKNLVSSERFELEKKGI